jgi:hypothetical protein
MIVGVSAGFVIVSGVRVLLSRVWIRLRLSDQLQQL